MGNLEGTLEPGTIAKFERAAQTLPRPISLGASRFLETGRLANVWFTTESVFRFLSIAVKSSYLAPGGEPSRRMNDLLRRYTTRPSMGDWFSFLQKISSDSEMSIQWWPFVEPAGMLKSICRMAEPLLGGRTRLHGHSGIEISAEAEEAGVRQFAPICAQVLDSIDFLSRYRLVVREDTNDEWRTWMGCDSTAFDSVPPSIAATSRALLLDLPRGTIDLFPLAISSHEPVQTSLGLKTERGVLTYDGVDYDRKRLEYVGGAHGRASAKTWFAHYCSLMQLRQAPTTPFRIEETPTLELQDRLSHAIENAIERLDEEKRWHGDAVDLDPEVSGLIDDAIASDSGAVLAIVCGDAGAGKTTHLLWAAQRAMERSEAALFVPASQLNDDLPHDDVHSFGNLLGAFLEHRLSLIGSSEAIIRRLASVPDVRRVTLFIDGLDELGGVRRVRRWLEQIVEWTRGINSAVANFRMILSIRGAYVDGLEDPRFRLQELGQLLYRPTRRELGGGDVVEQAIWLRPARDPSVIRARYEAFRQGVPGLRPEATFDELDQRIRRACANPRWMVSFLRHFHGRRLDRCVSPVELARDHLDEVVFSLIGTPPRPRYGDLVAMAEAFVRAERAHGQQGVLLKTLLEDPELKSLVQRGADGDVLLALQSAGVLRVEGVEDDPFSSPLVRAVDEFVEVALHMKERQLRKVDPTRWAAIADEHEDRRIGAVVDEAVIERLAEHLVGRPIDLPPLRPVLAAEVVRRLLAAGRGADVATWLSLTASSAREAISRVLLRRAREGNSYDTLSALGVALTEWAAGMHGPATIELTTRILRHAEDIPRVERWLLALADSEHGDAVLARFFLAEVLRDKGQWGRAAHHYAQVASAADVAEEQQLLAMAARGECHVWLQEPDRAIAYLTDAASHFRADTPPEVRCNVYLKRGIAERVRGKPVLAGKALVNAEAIAVQYNFAVEQTKITLEMGLVASLLGGHREAEELVRAALERHTAQGFVKGRKKGWFSLGYVLERAGRTREAVEAYEESLRLNSAAATYDTLGLALCHEALARVTRAANPTGAESHQRKADEFKAKLQITEKSNAPLL